MAENGGFGDDENAILLALEDLRLNNLLEKSYWNLFFRYSFSSFPNLL
jgi:hypothetical protein